MVVRWGLIGLAAGLGMGMACTGDPTVAPVEPTPPAPAPKAPAFDAAACEARVPHGPSFGTFEGRLAHGNRIALHLYRPEGGEPVAEGALPEAGDTVVGWAELQVTSTEGLLDVEGDLFDPFSLCLAAEDVQGTDLTGTVKASDRFHRVLSMNLTGPLPSVVVDQVTADEDWTAHHEAHAVPGYDRPADGTPYVLLRMGSLGDHAYATGLEAGHNLAGDVIVTWVGADGRGVFEQSASR